MTTENSHRLLLLGGKPIGSSEIAKAAKSKGYSVIVTDYLPIEESPVKQIADESWELSTDDIPALKERAIEYGIEGVLSGVHDFNIGKMAELAAELNLPCYCTPQQQTFCNDKVSFKAFCAEHGLDVAREYSEDDEALKDPSIYPLAVKPRDGSGSRGFSRCDSPDELDQAIENAKRSSFASKALIEEFVDSDALIAQYTAHGGKVIFSGLTDKHSATIGDTGSPIMALQIAPSIYTKEYLSKVDPAMKETLSALGMIEGPIWVELFHKNGRFIVNEIGYRFGGSLTYYLVKELYGIDQLDLLIDHAMGNSSSIPGAKEEFEGVYVIWPLHLKPGTIAKVEGIDWLEGQDGFVAFVPVHREGENIQDWGSAQQVFAYLHLKGDDINDLLSSMKEVQANLKVKDTEGGDMLFSLFDPSAEDNMPDIVLAHRAESAKA